MQKPLAKAACILWTAWVVLDYAAHHTYLTRSVVEPAYPLLLAFFAGLAVAGAVVVHLRSRREPVLLTYRGLYGLLGVQASAALVLAAFTSTDLLPEVSLPLRLAYFLGYSSLHLMGLFVLASAAYAVGSALLNPLRERMAGAFTVAAIGVGTAVTGSVLTVLGLLYIFKAVVIWPLIVLLLGWRWRAVVAFWRDSLWAPRSITLRHRWTPAVVIGLAAVLGVNLLAAFKTFPIGYDGSALYVNLASLVANSGELPYGGQAFGWSVIMALGETLYGSLTMTILLSHLMNVLLLLAVYRTARLYLRPETSLVATLLAASAPFLAFHGIIDEKTDLALGFMVLCSFLIGARAQVQEQVEGANPPSPTLSLFGGRWRPSALAYALLLAGFVAGFAFTIKYLALLYLIAFGAYLFYLHGGVRAFFGATLTALGLVFAGGLSRFGYLDLSSTAALVLGGGLLLAGATVLFLTYRRRLSGLLQLSLRVALVAVLFLVAFVPWAFKHVAEHGSLGVNQVIEGRSSAPELRYLPGFSGLDQPQPHLSAAHAKPAWYLTNNWIVASYANAQRHHDAPRSGFTSEASFSEETAVAVSSEKVPRRCKPERSQRPTKVSQNGKPEQSQRPTKVLQNGKPEQSQRPKKVPQNGNPKQNQHPTAFPQTHNTEPNHNPKAAPNAYPKRTSTPAPNHLHLTQLLSPDAGRNASEQAAREEIQRYLGYEPYFWRYFSLPYDLTMGTNLPGARYLDVGWLPWAFFPLLLLLVPGTRGRALLIGGVGTLAMVLYLAGAWYSVYAEPGVAFDARAVLNQLTTAFSGHAGGTNSVFARVYLALAAPLAALSEALALPFALLGNLTLWATILLMIGAACGGYFLLRPRLDHAPVTLKAFGGLLAVYGLTWWLLGNGIVWYGMPLFVLLPVFLLWFLDEPARFLGPANQRFSGIFGGLLVGLLLAGNLAVYFTSSFPGDGRTDTLFRWPFVDAASNPQAVSAETVDRFNPAIRSAMAAINADPAARVYRVNTHYGFFIENNDLRVFSDPTLDRYAEISERLGDRSNFFDILKAQGFKYILFDLKTGMQDNTPEKSLQKKFVSIAEILTTSDKVSVVATDNYVSDPNAPAIRLPGGEVKNARMGLRGNTVALGNLALFEIK